MASLQLFHMTQFAQQLTLFGPLSEFRENFDQGEDSSHMTQMMMSDHHETEYKSLSVAESKNLD